MEEGRSSGSRVPSGGGGTVDGFNARNGKVHSSFRISPVAEVFSNISAAKEKILQKMNFSGLMYLPKDESESNRQFKLQFSFWLLMKIDSETGNLDLGRRGHILLTEEDVELVLGLRSEGEELSVHDPAMLEHNKEIIRRNLLLQPNEEIDFQSIKKVLERDIFNSTEGKMANAYMTAVVIYAASWFLAPKGRPPKVNTEIFDSIVNPEKILKLNWSSYVLKTLRESSAKIKEDILAKNSSVCLDGCLLFLQIAYLDHLQLGVYTTTQYKWPRVADFSYARLKELVTRDKRKGECRTEDQYGRSELRHDAEIFYTRGVLYRNFLDRQDSAFTKLPSEYELDKILDYIDAENVEHKRKIVRLMEEQANQLCSLSDRHCGDIKKIVSRWMSVSIYKERDCDNEGYRRSQHYSKDVLRRLFGDGRSQVPGRDRDTAETSRKNVAGKKSSVKEDQENEVVDLTGSEDENGKAKATRGSNMEEISTKKGKGAEEAKEDESVFKATGVNKEPRKEKTGYQVVTTRCSTKRTANRTPKAIRKQCLSTIGGDYQLQGCIPSGSMEWVERNLLKHEIEDVRLADQLHENVATRKGQRTKHVAIKRLKTTEEKEMEEENVGSNSEDDARD